MSGLLGILICYWDVVPKQSAKSQSRYVRVRKGDTNRRSVYRILDKREDDRRRVVKRYKRVNLGHSTRRDTHQDEWTAVRGRSKHKGQSAGSENKHKKEKHTLRTCRQPSYSKRMCVDKPCGRTANLLGRCGSALEERVDSVIAAAQEADHPQFAAAVDNSRRQRVTAIHKKNDSAPHGRNASQRLIKQGLQSTNQQRTIKIVESDNHIDVQDRSSPEDTLSIRRRPGNPFKQPQMTTQQSQTMIFGGDSRPTSRVRYINGEARSRAPSASNFEDIAESQGVLRHRQTARLRDETTPEGIHATITGLKQFSIADNEHE
jgi:hypothetical protein